MDISLSRAGGIPVRRQLARQLELKILGGEIRSGARLPSVRALARHLRIHPNTVSEAYRCLEAAGHVLLQRGAGVFVRGTGPTDLAEARGIDEMIRLALGAAERKGYSGKEVKSAVERWLQAAPPKRIVVVDPCREMAELLVHEIRPRVEVDVDASSVREVEADPRLFSGTMMVCVPYHVARLRTLVAGSLVEAVTVGVPQVERAAIQRLAPGSIVLVVSHAATLLPFAEVLLKSVKGDDVHAEVHSLADRAAWSRLAPVADLVFADGLSAPHIGPVRQRPAREFRVVSAAAIERIVGGLSRPVVGG